MTDDPLIESILEALQNAPDDPGALFRLIAQRHGTLAATELAHGLDVAAKALEGMFKREGRPPRAAVRARIISADVRALDARMKVSGMREPTCAQLAEVWGRTAPPPQD